MQVVIQMSLKPKLPIDARLVFWRKANVDDLKVHNVALLESLYY